MNNIANWIAAIFSLANVAAFLFWLTLISTELSPANTASEVLYDRIAFTIVLLEVFIFVASLSLAVLAIWGYQGIRNQAATKASEVAEKVTNEEIKRFRERFDQEMRGLRANSEPSLIRSQDGGEAVPLTNDQA